MAVKARPEGYQSVIPYIVVKNVSGLLEFIESVFDGKVEEKMEGPNGSVMHAQARIGDSVIMMGEPREEDQKMPAMMYLYVDDVNKTYNKAIKAGATSLMEPENKFYGDRSGGVQDAQGNKWWLATHVEDVSPEEMDRRMKAELATASA